MGAAVADQADRQRRGVGREVALEGGQESVVGDQGGRFDGAGAGDVGEQMVEQGAAADRNQRLRGVREQGAHAGAVAGGEQNRGQGFGGLTRSGTMAKPSAR